MTDNNLPLDFSKGTGSNLHPVVFGSVGDVAIAPFTAVEVMADPFTGLETSQVRIYMKQSIDARLQHNDSLAVITDAII